jgi:transcriptional regulator with XRE-family HTH domain
MLGERIAALRRARGLSQAELAVKLKISASAMGMYEQGRREPSAQMLVLLARELEVSTDFLLTGASPAGDDPLPALVAYCVDAADRDTTAPSAVAVRACVATTVPRSRDPSATRDRPTRSTLNGPKIWKAEVALETAPWTMMRCLVWVTTRS